MMRRTQKGWWRDTFCFVSGQMDKYSHGVFAFLLFFLITSDDWWELLILMMIFMVAVCQYLPRFPLLTTVIIMRKLIIVHQSDNPFCILSFLILLWIISSSPEFMNCVSDIRSFQTSVDRPHCASTKGLHENNWNEKCLRGANECMAWCYTIIVIIPEKRIGWWGEEEMLWENERMKQLQNEHKKERGKWWVDLKKMLIPLNDG